MDEDKEKNRYLEDLKELVGFYDDGYMNFSMLFRFLLDINFVADNELDENRESDIYGLLRVPYGALEDEPWVSVLELLISLALRISNSVVGDENPGLYFWEWLDNLGLLMYDDRHFSEKKVTEIIDIWLKKKYKSNGKGSPWVLKNSNFDVRGCDIWRHCNLYISENYI